MFRPWLITAVLFSVLFIVACDGGTPSLPAAVVSTTSHRTTTAATPDTLAASPSASPSADAFRVTLVPGSSQALYRAREQLASIAFPTDAVGKTTQVSGVVAFTSSGQVDSSASKITIDLSTLQSDKPQRDNFIKQRTLDTARYPDAVFVPTAVLGLPWPLPASGQVTFKLTGNLTVRGVTKPTTWDVSATLDTREIRGTATTTVTFEDFGMTPPTAAAVLNVEDRLTLELDFTASRPS